MKIKGYYFFHFGLIFIVSLSSVITSYVNHYEIKNENLTKVNGYIKKLLYNPIYHSYTIFSGTNTGYGFYGINVATHKFFSVELYDEDKKLIYKTNNFGIKGQNNLSRFEVLASKMANFIVENKNFPENENPEILKTRKLYVEKIFKYIGRFEANKVTNCKHYKVILYTLMPSDIRKDNNYNTSKKIGIYESIEFEI